MITEKKNFPSLPSGRRNFLKKSLLALSVLPLLKLVGRVTPAHAQAVPTKALDLNDQMAKILGYDHDRSKIDAVKFPRLKDPTSAGAKCSNCMLWQQGGLKVEGMPGEWGFCTLFQNGLVNAEGWCNSWAKKA